MITNYTGDPMFGRKKTEDPLANHCASGLSMALSAGQSPMLGGGILPVSDISHMQRVLDEQRRQYARAQAEMLAPVKDRYARFTLTVEQCEGGYVVEVGGRRHIVTDLTKAGELAVAHLASLTLEND